MYETPTDIPHKLRTFMSLVCAYSCARDEKYTGKPKWKISLERSRRREVNTFTVDLKEAGVGCVLNNLSGNGEILCTELKKQRPTFSFCKTKRSNFHCRQLV